MVHMCSEDRSVWSVWKNCFRKFGREESMQLLAWLQSSINDTIPHFNLILHHLPFHSPELWRGLPQLSKIGDFLFPLAHTAVLSFSVTWGCQEGFPQRHVGQLISQFLALRVLSHVGDEAWLTNLKIFKHPYNDNLGVITVAISLQKHKLSHRRGRGERTPEPPTPPPARTLRKFFPRYQL